MNVLALPLSVTVAEVEQTTTLASSTRAAGTGCSATAVAAVAAITAGAAAAPATDGERAVTAQAPLARPEPRFAENVVPEMRKARAGSIVNAAADSRPPAPPAPPAPPMAFWPCAPAPPSAPNANTTVPTGTTVARRWPDWTKSCSWRSKATRPH